MTFPCPPVDVYAHESAAACCIILWALHLERRLPQPPGVLGLCRQEAALPKGHPGSSSPLKEASAYGQASHTPHQISSVMVFFQSQGFKGH